MSVVVGYIGFRTLQSSLSGKFGGAALASVNRLIRIIRTASQALAISLLMPCATSAESKVMAWALGAKVVNEKLPVSDTSGWDGWMWQELPTSFQTLLGKH